MWIDTRECIPLADGEYMVQTVSGDVTLMNYTFKAGWNTHYDKNGVLYSDKAIENEWVARWFKVPAPPEVPKKWKDEYLRKEQ